MVRWKFKALPPWDLIPSVIRFRKGSVDGLVSPPMKTVTGVS